MKLRIVLTTLALACFASQPQSAFSADVQAGPDLNGFWTHGFSLGFDPPPEGGTGPVQDFKTRPQMRAMSVAFDDHGESVPGRGTTTKYSPPSTPASSCGP